MHISLSYKTMALMIDVKCDVRKNSKIEQLGVIKVI